MTNFKDKELFH